jgi:DNA-directed RNA polymerase subunit RPC12/RpoP
MPSEVSVNRELARAFWAKDTIRCPKHPGATLRGSFVQTTFADHIVLSCPQGRETITIPQRPKQMQFLEQQVEGLVESMQRGDAIRCYRCQSKIEVEERPDRDTGIIDHLFTCVRCLSWGRWVGNPALAKIGAD